MYSVRPYQIGDLRRLDLRDYERKWLEIFPIADTETRMQLDKSFTVFKDENPIAAYGIFIYWPGVAEIWLSLSTAFYKAKLSCIRLLKTKLEELMVHNKLHRIHTLISAELPANQKFCAFFGFVPEGRQRKYGPWGDDYIMYAKVI